MKKILLSALLVLTSLPIFAQLNVQMHYDFGDAFYGDKLSNRPHLLFPNAATKRQILDRFIELLLMAALGIGAAALVLFFLALS